MNSKQSKVIQELTKALEHLENSNKQFGNEKTTQIVNQLTDQVKFVIENQDSKMAKDLINEIIETDFTIVDQGAGVALELSIIKDCDDNFDMYDWKNRTQARQLIIEAKKLISDKQATKIDDEIDEE